MFVLARMTDCVRIPPHEFAESFQKSLQKTLSAKFANKVVLNVGLCVCFYDFEKIHDSYVLPGDGASHTKVEFRIVVFRPFVDEILIGRIKGCDKDGITLTMGFFDDILVRAENLPVPSKFEAADFLWYWEYGGDDGTAQQLYMDPGKVVRFRVLEEMFTDTQPSGESPTSPTLSVTADSDKQTPYLVIASMSEPGLGPLIWWETAAEEDAADDS